MLNTRCREAGPTAPQVEGTWRVDISAAVEGPSACLPTAPCRLIQATRIRPASEQRQPAPCAPSSLLNRTHSESTSSKQPPSHTQRGTRRQTSAQRHDHKAASKPLWPHTQPDPAPHATPARYAVQWLGASPSVPFGQRVQINTSTAARVCVDTRRTTRSERGDNATNARCGNAVGELRLCCYNPHARQ